MYGAGAAFFCLEPEQTQFGRIWSRLRDLGTSGAAQKSGGSATLDLFARIRIRVWNTDPDPQRCLIADPFCDLDSQH